MGGKRFDRDRRGASFIEMGVLIGLIAVGALVAVDRTGGQVSNLFDGVAGGLGAAQNSVVGAGADGVGSGSGSGGGDDGGVGWQGIALLDGANVLSIDRDTGAVIGTASLPGSASWLALAGGEVFAAGSTETYRLAPGGGGLTVEATIPALSTGLLADGTDLVYAEDDGAARARRRDRSGAESQIEGFGSFRVKRVHEPIHDNAGLIGLQYQTFTTATYPDQDLVEIVWRRADGTKGRYRTPYTGANNYGHCGYGTRGPAAMTPGPAGSFYAACPNGGSFYSNIGRVNTSDGSFVWYDRQPDLGLPVVLEAHDDWLYAGYDNGTLVKMDGNDGSIEWSGDLGARVLDIAVDAAGEVYTLHDGGALVRTGPDGTQRWTSSAPGGLKIAAE